MGGFYPVIASSFDYVRKKIQENIAEIWEITHNVKFR